MKWLQGQVVKKQVWEEGLFTLSVRVPGIDPFEPGQFLQLGVPLPDKHLHRPYSVASPHGEVLEFFIVLVEKGHLTPILWQMKEGDTIDVSQKAAGSFTLSHAPQSRDLWLIGTGTGLAPFIAMLRTEEIWQRYQQVVVVNGVRYGRDLAYQEELEGYKKSRSGRFHSLSVVSRESHPGAMHGRITHVLGNGVLEQSAGLPLDPQHSTVMLCGNPDMLDEMEAMLGIKGLQKHRAKEPGQIVIERYW